MGLMVWLIIEYVLLLAIAIGAFVKKNSRLGVGIISFLVFQILFFGFMWFSSTR